MYWTAPLGLNPKFKVDTSWFYFVSWGPHVSSPPDSWKKKRISPATAPLKKYGWISSSFSWQIQCLTFFGGEKSVLTHHVFTIFDTWNTWTSEISMFSACLLVKPVDSPFFSPYLMSFHGNPQRIPWPSVAIRGLSFLLSDSRPFMALSGEAPGTRPWNPSPAYIVM